jgi:hypothetical protein
MAKVCPFMHQVTRFNLSLIAIASIRSQQISISAWRNNQLFLLGIFYLAQREFLTITEKISQKRQEEL